MCGYHTAAAHARSSLCPPPFLYNQINHGEWKNGPVFFPVEIAGLVKRTAHFTA